MNKNTNSIIKDKLNEIFKRVSDKDGFNDNIFEIVILLDDIKSLLNEEQEEKYESKNNI